MRVPVQITAACLLIISVGLHWALLQTVAWTGMVITYSQRSSLSEAISDTFDGEHPCALCKIVREGRAHEQKQDGQKINHAVKLVAIIWQQTDFIFDCGKEPIPPGETVADARHESPPKPRPRLV